MSKKKNSNAVEAVGTPTLLMLPARNYKFKVYQEDYVLTIPRKGVYTELNSEVFKEEDGEFHILTDVDVETKEQIFYMPSISKVLFGVSKYPALEDGFAFVPTAFVFRENEVDIIGNIIEMEEG